MKLGPIATKMGRRASVNVLIAAAITNTLPGLLNTRRVFTASAEMAPTVAEPAPKFQRLQRIQFIAALGEPGASSNPDPDPNPNPHPNLKPKPNPKPKPKPKPKPDPDPDPDPDPKPNPNPNPTPKP
eukprot:scaffold111859_cov42-Phaeocystis_antarctica.AAC.1